MRISILKKREPFNKILLNTLRKYLYRYDNNADIYFKKKVSLSLVGCFNQIYFANSYLNYFSKFKTSSKYFKVLKFEYGYSKYIILTIIRKIILSIFFAKFGRLLFSTEYLIINSSSKVLDNAVILGGNHRIRILFLDLNLTKVILKAGFEKRWIDNEIIFRKGNNQNFIPKLIDAEEMEFTEEYILGIPLNRLAESKCNELTLHAAKLLFSEITVKSIEKFNLNVWLISKKKIIIKDFDSSIGMKENNISKMFYEFLETLTTKLSLLDEKKNIYIQVARTHGDFQHSNILLKEDNSLVFIDWESTDKRWFGYDFFTLFMGSRSGGLPTENLFLEVLNNKLVLIDILFSHLDSELAYLMFLLEELHYQVLNNCNINFYTVGSSLAEYMAKLRNNLFPAEK